MVKNHKIKIYSTEMCMWCVKAKEFFRENKIKFEEVDVNKDRKAAMEMIKKSGQTGVPVIEIRKNHSVEIIIGFNEKRLREALNIK